MDREQKLDKVITAYLKAVDAGQLVDQADWIRRYPELADGLAEFFASQQSVERVAAPLRDAGGTPSELLPSPLGRAGSGVIGSADAATLPPYSPSNAPSEPETIAPDAATPDTADGALPVKVRYFGHYELLEEIARGGMGIVYKARQVKLRRLVAVKMILAGELANATEVERFHTEARAAARLHHPHIVSIHEVGQHDGQHYFSMDFIAGESLANRIARGPLPAREAAVLLKKVAAAVAFAHVEGVIHRDLKPANVLLDAKGEPHVTDFGLAKAVSGELLSGEWSNAPLTTQHSTLTITGQILGTPSYMPPEQAAGRTKEIGPRADVYSLGAVLYCALIGRPPFQAASTLDTLLQVLDRDPVPPRSLNAAVPRDLETICLKCLEKAPRRRYQSAQELVDELDRYLEGRPILARPIGIAGRTVKWMKRRPTAAALIGVTIVAALALGTTGTLYQAELREALRDAKDQRNRVQERETVLRRHLYGYDIKAIQEARTKENMVRALTLLKAHIPKPDQGDVRSFDWFHFWKLNDDGVVTHRTGASESVAYAANGEYLVTAGGAGADRLIELRDPQSGGLLRTLRDIPGTIVAISKDSKALAVAGTTEIAVLDLATGERRQVLKLGNEKEGWIRQVEFSPTDPDSLAVVWGDSRVGKNIFAEVRLIHWPDKNDRSLVKFPGDYGARIAFRPDGKVLAIAADRGITLWDLATNQPARKLQYDARALAFTPDAKLLAFVQNSYDGNLQLIDATNGKSLGELPLKARTAMDSPLAFSADGKILASAGDMSLRLWDVATRKEIGTRLGHTGRITSLAFSKDGKRLASCAPRGDAALVGSKETGELKIWEVAEHPVPEPVALEYRQYFDKTSYSSSSYTITSLGFAPGSNRLVIGAIKSGSTSRLPPPGLENDLVFERPEYSSRGGPIQLRSVTAAPTTHALSWQSVNLRRAAYSPDNRFIAVAQPRYLKSVAIWDTASGQTVTSLSKDHAVYGVTFSPDGKTLAAASLDRTVTLWDVPTWTERAVLRGHEQWIDTIAIASDNQTLVTASYEGVVKIWNLTTGKERGTLPRHFRRLDFLTLSPDGQNVLVGGLRDDQERDMKLWDLPTGKEKLNLATCQFGLATTVFSSDGKFLAVSRKDKKENKYDITLLDVASGNTIATLPGSAAFLALAPDGKSLAANYTAKGITIWNLADQKPLAQLTGAKEIRSLLFSPDGKSLAGWSDERLRVWDTAGYKERFNQPSKQYQEFWTVAFTSDSTLLATQRINAPEVRFWDCATGKERYAIVADGGSGLPPLLAPDGKTVVTDNWTIARLWDLSGKERAKSASEQSPQSLAMTPDGNTLLATIGANEQRATLWDAAAGREKLQLRPSPSPIDGGVFSADGRTLATSHQDGSIQIWNAADGQPLHTLADVAKDNHISRLAFSADGKLLAAAGSDRNVRIWDVATGAKLATLPVQANRNLAYSPAGDLLATVDDQNMIRLWDWKTGEERLHLTRDLRDNTSSAHVLAFSADGRTLATCENRAVRFWDTTTGLERLTLWQANEDLQHLAFSPDGRTLAAAGQNRVYLWYAASENEVGVGGR